jgi:hypothetical protein
MMRHGLQGGAVVGLAGADGLPHGVLRRDLGGHDVEAVHHGFPAG